MKTKSRLEPSHQEELNAQNRQKKIRWEKQVIKAVEIGLLFNGVNRADAKVRSCVFLRRRELMSTTTEKNRPTLAIIIKKRTRKNLQGTFITTLKSDTDRYNFVCHQQEKISL